jgi:Fe-S-cluster-containing hydrogenase component 2
MNEEKCIGCGFCIEFCPMRALELRDKKVIFTPERCIGCGVCVHKCPEEAIVLIRRDDEQDYPRDPREEVYRFLQERGRDPLKIFEKNSL